MCRGQIGAKTVTLSYYCGFKANKGLLKTPTADLKKTIFGHFQKEAIEIAKALIFVT